MASIVPLILDRGQRNLVGLAEIWANCGGGGGTEQKAAGEGGGEEGGESSNDEVTSKLLINQGN